MRGLLKPMTAAGVLAIAGLVGGCGGGGETGSPPAPVSPPAGGPTASPAALEYHCEMHPEVVSSKPGTCPRCKMALTKK